MQLTQEQKDIHINRRGYHLDYLFEVEFVDGSIYKQTQEDISELVPCACVEGAEECEGRNCYYDVRQMVNDGKVIRKFRLIGTYNIICVDLGTGLFEVNGFPIIVESEKLPILPSKFDLIWYHQVTIQQNVTTDNNTGEVVRREDLPMYREYFIGWSCTINGKNYQQKIGVA